MPKIISHFGCTNNIVGLLYLVDSSIFLSGVANCSPSGLAGTLKSSKTNTINKEKQEIYNVDFRRYLSSRFLAQIPIRCSDTVFYSTVLELHTFCVKYCTVL